MPDAARFYVAARDLTLSLSEKNAILWRQIMGVGLYLLGSLPRKLAALAPESCLGKMAEWWQTNGGEAFEYASVGQDYQGQPTLFVQLHPCAEDVEFILTEPSRLIVSAKTSTAGPGYHTHVCDKLHEFGSHHQIAWDKPDEEEGTGDETGYFFNRDVKCVETEMLVQLKSMAKIALENLEKGYTGLMVNMGIGHHYPNDGPIITPLGPKDQAWCETVAADPRKGKGFFPWWSQGTGASFHLGRALSNMWSNVRWRVPLTDKESELLKQTHFDLNTAYRLDSKLLFPWREWQEILGYLEKDSGEVEDELAYDLRDIIENDAGNRSEQPLIGYRRKPVRVDVMAGWSIEIPGEMAESWEDDGRTWCAWAGGRTVWLSSISFKKGDGSLPSCEEMLEQRDVGEGPVLDHQGRGILGHAAFKPYEEEGQKLWNLKTLTAAPGNLAICNFYLESKADRDWAVATWHSLYNTQI